MKKLLFRAIPAMALSAALAVSCQKEQEGGENTVPVFPEPVTEYVAPGETVEIAFSANMDWTASIPAEDAAEYFRIIDGSQEAYSVRGKAGDAVITIKCNGTQDFENHSVDLSLTMGGQTEVIASVILPSLERKFGLKTADLNEDGSGFVASSDGKFDWTYTGSDVADGGDINMVWVNEDKAYRIYVLADANFGYTVTVPEGVSYKAGKTSGTGIEYSFTVSDINTGDEALVHGISFTAKDDETETHSFNLNVPPFEAEFSVYPVIADENGYAYDETGLGFTWGYEEEPVAEGGDITLIWPEGQMGYGFHILVDANFEYTVEKPEWLAMTERNTVGTVKEYDFSVDKKDYFLHGGKGTMTFTMTGADNIEYSYGIIFPDCSGEVRFSRIVEGSTVKFDTKGNYYQNDYPVEGAYSGEAVCAEGLSFYCFHKDTQYGYTAFGGASDWMSVTYTWMKDVPETSDEYKELIHSDPVTVTVSENKSSSREGLILAIPAVALEGVLVDQDDPAITFFEGPDYLSLKPEYEQYVMIYVNQEGTGGSVVPEGITFAVPDDATIRYYEQLGYFEFKEFVTEDDMWEDEDAINYGGEVFMNGGKVYKITYRNNGLEGSFYLNYTGEYDPAAIRYAYPGQTNFIGAEGYEGQLYLFMSLDGKSEATKGAVYFKEQGAESESAVLICVRDYTAK